MFRGELCNERAELEESVVRGVGFEPTPAYASGS